MVQIRAVYMQVYLIRLLVLAQLLITVLWRNDNSSLGLLDNGNKDQWDDWKVSIHHGSTSIECGGFHFTKSFFILASNKKKKKKKSLMCKQTVITLDILYFHCGFSATLHFHGLGYWAVYGYIPCLPSNILLYHQH